MSELAAAQSPFVNRPIRAAIIDLDGTMVDTADDFVAALNAMLARIGVEQPVTRDEVTGYVGKGSENLIRSVLAVRLSPLQAAAQFDVPRDGAIRAVGGDAGGAQPQIAGARVGELCVERYGFRREVRLPSKSAGNAGRQAIE